MHAVILPVLGVASLFAMQFVSVLQGRGAIALPFSLPQIILALLLGTLCGGVIMNPPRAGKSAPICLLCFSSASGLFWCDSIFNGHDVSSYAACFFGAMLLPPLLSRLLAFSTSPGFHLGLALAIGDFFWLFLYFLPAPLSSQTLQGILAGLVLLGGCLGAAAEYPLKPRTDQAGTKVGPSSSGKESVLYLTAIAGVFFLQNSLVDIPFYRMHAATFTIPAYAHLYIWPVYILSGWFIDKYGADIRLFLACVAGNIFSPAFVGFSESTATYWAIYSASLASRAVGLIYLVLVFGRIRNKFALPALVVALPFLTLLGSLELVYLLVARFPGTTYILLLGLFLVASFSYISSRIQFALTLSGSLVPTPGKIDAVENSDAEQNYPPEVFAHFSEKYGISPREQDVLQLVVEGQSTSSICESLHITDNTVKSHIRQLLRKTESENRTMLVVLFFNEARQVVTPIKQLNTY